MHRREVIAVLGGAAWPVAARGQRPGATRRIGLLMAGPETDPERQAYVATFREALAGFGWTEGGNITIQLAWSAPAPAAMRAAAEALIAQQPSLIVAHNTALTAALRQHAGTIPIVFALVSDPVGSGFVASIARPGGTLTGFTNNDPEMGGKWVELLKEIAPRVGRVACLFNPATSPYAEFYLASFRRSAQTLGVEATTLAVRDAAAFAPAIARQAGDGGLVVMTDAFFVGHRKPIIALAAEHRVPAIYPFRSFVADSGLISYGSAPADNFRRCAGYADRILRGARAGELPVQAPVSFELAINSGTAKALGLPIPPALLARAQDVIE